MRRSLVANFICIFPLLCSYSHAQWTEPVRITSNPHLGTPRGLAVGDTLHVCARTTTKIYYLRSTDGGGTWTDPICPVDTFYRSYWNHITHSSNRVHLAFVGRIDVQNPLKLYTVSSLDGGDSWEEPIEVYHNGWKYPRLAVTGDTVFLSCAIPGHILALRSNDNGETWGEPAVVDSGPLVIDHSPTISYSRGRLHIVYQINIVGDSAGVEIYHRYSDDHGDMWSDRFPLSTVEYDPDYRHSQFPSAMADSLGNLVALWFDYKYGSECGFTGDILGRVSRDNGETWRPETRISFTQTGSSSSCLILEDTLYAIWMDEDYLGCGYPKLMHSKSGDWGESWDRPELIDGSAELLEYAPDLFCGNQGISPILHCVMPAEPVGGPADLYYTRNAIETRVDDESSPPVSVSSTLTAYPNPFNSNTVLTLDGSEAGDAILGIYDVRGRLVKRLNLSDAGGGDKRTVWDATDNSGRSVSTGIYFARVEISRSVRTPQTVNFIKILYLR